MHRLAIDRASLTVNRINQNRLGVHNAQFSRVFHQSRHDWILINLDKLVSDFEQDQVQMRPVRQGGVVLRQIKCYKLVAAFSVVKSVRIGWRSMSRVRMAANEWGRWGQQVKF